MIRPVKNADDFVKDIGISRRPAPGHPSAAASRVPWIWRPPDLIQKIEQTSIIIIIIIKSRDINSSVIQWDT